MNLEARSLALGRGERWLFTDLSLTVAPGEALRVTGANGAGKSSLLRVLCGLSRPDSGELRWLGAAPLYLGHADAVKPDLQAWENVAYANVEHYSGKAEAMRCLESFGLARQADLPTRFLSQGQRKRVALCRLLLEPRSSLWILDEPFNALDAGGATIVRTLIEQHLAAAGLLVYTTHGPDLLVPTRSIAVDGASQC